MECRGFHWIGQTWASCDRCGRPWQEHDGLHTLKPEIRSPFGETDGDDWFIRPWSEVDGGPAGDERRSWQEAVRR